MLLSQSLLAWGEEGPGFFLWCSDKDIIVKKLFFISYCFLVLWLEVEYFVVCIPWHFWIAGFFISKTNINEAKIKPREVMAVSLLGPRVL